MVCSRVLNFSCSEASCETSTLPDLLGLEESESRFTQEEVDEPRDEGSLQEEILTGNSAD